MSLDLHAGAEVLSGDRQKLGKLSRVVVTKSALKITHVVVDTGIFRGERVVPLGALASVTSERIELTMSGAEFHEHSVNYDTESFQPMPDLEPGKLDLSDLKRFAASIPGEPGPFVIHDVLAKSPDEVDIKKDSPVYRLNPYKKLGEVERVLFDEKSGKVTELVIRRGFLFTYDVVLPATYIADVVEALRGLIFVDMTDEQVDALKVYEEAQEG